MVLLALREHQEKQAYLGRLGKRGYRDLADHRAKGGLLDHLDLRDFLAREATWDPRAFRDPKER